MSPLLRPLFRAAATVLVTATLLLGQPLTSQASTVSPTPTPTPTPTITAVPPKPVAPPAPVARPTRAQKVLKAARSLKGRPYRYGAAGPKSFDCAGYVQFVYRKAGVKIGRTSGAQLKGTRIAKSRKKPGDVLVFMRGGRAYHSAIYAGDGKMWEAQRSGTKVGKHRIWSSGYVVRRPRA